MAGPAAPFCAPALYKEDAMQALADLDFRDTPIGEFAFAATRAIVWT
jgi:hypothetical protein